MLYGLNMINTVTLKLSDEELSTLFTALVMVKESPSFMSVFADSVLVQLCTQSPLYSQLIEHVTENVSKLP